MNGKEISFLNLSRGEGESCPSLELKKASTYVQIQPTCCHALEQDRSQAQIALKSYKTPFDPPRAAHNRHEMKITVTVYVVRFRLNLFWNSSCTFAFMDY
jgi:hypothetical protein